MKMGGPVPEGAQARAEVMMSTGQWAVVTGASSGIGRAFATQLASNGFSVVLIARRTRVIEELASELRARFRVDADAISADLSTPEGRAVAVGAIHLHAPLGFLVNAAGFGVPGHFIDNELPRQRLFTGLTMS